MNGEWCSAAAPTATVLRLSDAAVATGSRRTGAAGWDDNGHATPAWRVAEPPTTIAALTHGLHLLIDADCINSNDRAVHTGCYFGRWLLLGLIRRHRRRASSASDTAVADDAAVDAITRPSATRYVAGAP